MPGVGTILCLGVGAAGALLFLRLVADSVAESRDYLKAYRELKRKQYKRWAEFNNITLNGAALRRG